MSEQGCTFTKRKISEALTVNFVPESLPIKRMGRWDSSRVPQAQKWSAPLAEHWLVFDDLPWAVQTADLVQPQWPSGTLGPLALKSLGRRSTLLNNISILGAQTQQLEHKAVLDCGSGNVRSEPECYCSSLAALPVCAFDKWWCTFTSDFSFEIAFGNLGLTAAVRLCVCISRWSAETFSSQTERINVYRYQTYFWCYFWFISITTHI